uniref:Uncharacterized protein n=1 Tax=Ciona intestinalis TaxID=7719 RepID=H2Y325_CIOIN
SLIKIFQQLNTLITVVLTSYTPSVHYTSHHHQYNDNNQSAYFTLQALYKDCKVLSVIAYMIV